MADSTINGLTALTGANVDNTADQFAIWQNSASTTKKITRTELLTGIPAGTAAAPAISPTGDSNTGTYYPAADTIGFVTGGSERLRINSTGQVGIGKTPTLGLLDVNADAYFNTVRVGLGGGAVASNTAVGNGAMAATATGTDNVAIGINSLNSLTSGLSNTCVGRRSGYVITTGSQNVAVGATCLNSLVSGSFNVAVGQASLSANTASDNTAVGFAALTANTSGTDNVAVGRSALAANVTSNNNTAVGRSALASNTASNNTAVGALALQANTTGASNVAVGISALSSNVTGAACTAVGRMALASNTANDNTAVGHNALTTNTSGTSNVAVGRAALEVSLTANQCTAVGRSALALSTASDNTALGWQAGNVLTTGASNTIIGSDADASGATGTGQIVIGKGVTGTANNRITVGITTNIAELDLDGADTSWAASSDERLKQDIATYTAGLDVITALRPVTFRWKAKRDVPTELTNYYADSDEPVHGDASKTYHGFIAQEVKAVLDSNPSVPNGQHLWEQRDDGVQTLAPADLVPILVNAIKQLHAEVQALKNA